MVLGPAVRGTTGPRTTCPGGQFFGGTSGPATPYVEVGTLVAAAPEAICRYVESRTILCCC